MTLADYLASEAAQEHAKDMIAHKQDAAFPVDGGWRDWRRAQIGAWTRLSTDGICCYFRPDGERFIVTDLGEGVRALRLRTGDVTQPAFEPRGCWQYGDILGADKVTGADLPDAICRVMLASLRVAGVGR